MRTNPESHAAKVGAAGGSSKGVLRLDILAGLTAAAVVVPKALAYATIAGLPVQVGLYTASVPMVVYAVLGTSRPLSVSTTTTLAILTGAELGRVAPGGGAELIAASATLAVLVGVLLLLASAIRLGFVANFISEPVLTGFKSGIGLVTWSIRFRSCSESISTKPGSSGICSRSSVICRRPPWRRWSWPCRYWR